MGAAAEKEGQKTDTGDEATEVASQLLALAEEAGLEQLRAVAIRYVSALQLCVPCFLHTVPEAVVVIGTSLSCVRDQKIDGVADGLFRHLVDYEMSQR